MIKAIRNYNREGLKQKMLRDFKEYAWSLRSSDRRLSYFNIHRHDTSVSVEDVKTAINKKLMGLG